jgi:hypothetical protein
MPYRTDGAAEFHLPAKTREYLMAGRPIISTRLPELEGAYGDLVTTAGKASEFVSLCHETLKNPDRKRLRNGMRTALSRTWAQVAGEVHQHLQQLTGVIAV